MMKQNVYANSSEADALLLCTTIMVVKEIRESLVVRLHP